MHELAITRAILDIVLEKATENRASKIKTIDLQVGRLTGYIPESILLQFRFLSRGTIADGAGLNFKQPPAVLYCRRCDQKFSTERQDLTCPACHTPSAEVVSGLELSVESIDVD